MLRFPKTETKDSIRVVMLFKIIDPTFNGSPLERANNVCTFGIPIKVAGGA